MMKSMTNNIWCIDYPQNLLGIPIGSRTTIIKLQSGVAVHSPGPLSDNEWAEVSSIGEVKWIIAPNNFHHLYVEGAQSKFPQAQLFIAPGLKAKRKNLKYSAVLPEVGFSDELQPIYVRGSAMQETVFFHKASQTFICTDFMHEISSNYHWSVRLYSKIMGFYKKPGVSRPIKLFAYKNKKNARSSLLEITNLSIDRIIPAHGEVFEKDCIEKIKAAYSWLL